MHGTNEGNPYEVDNVPHGKVEVSAIEAEFSETGFCPIDGIDTDAPEVMQEPVYEDSAETEEVPVGEMSAEEYQAFLEEQRQIAEEYERYKEEASLFNDQ